jgi:hypothetical protein
MQLKALVCGEMTMVARTVEQKVDRKVDQLVLLDVRMVAKMGVRLVRIMVDRMAGLLVGGKVEWWADCSAEKLVTRSADW